MATAERKRELLLKPVWNYKDIMEYFGVKTTLAFGIKHRALDEQDGYVKWGNGLVKTDSVLALYGTNRKQELEIIRSYENNDDDMMVNYEEDYKELLQRNL
jgi:hypothetical protein